MKKRVPIVLGCMASALLILGGCASDNGKTGGSGLIETDEVLVSSEVSGKVTLREFDEGMTVAAGDTLVTIDSDDLVLQIEALRATRKVTEANLTTARIQVDQAQATRSFAAKEFDRVSELAESGTASQRQFDKAQHEFTMARQALAAAESQVVTVEAEIFRIDADLARLNRTLRDYTILSPVAGTVTEEFIEAGELLMPGKAIARISRLDTVWVKIYLNAGDFASITLGQSATVDTEAGGETFACRVIWTSDQAEFTPKNVQTKESRTDLVYAVKVSVPNPERTLKVGMPVYVTLD